MKQALTTENILARFRGCAHGSRGTSRRVGDGKLLKPLLLPVCNVAGAASGSRPTNPLRLSPEKWDEPSEIFFATTFERDDRLPLVPSRSKKDPPPQHLIEILVGKENRLHPIESHHTTH